MTKIHMTINGKRRQVQINGLALQLASQSELTSDRLRYEIERSVIHTWSTLHFSDFKHSFDECIEALCEAYGVRVPDAINSSIIFCAGMREGNESDCV